MCKANIRLKVFQIFYNYITTDCSILCQIDKFVVSKSVDDIFSLEEGD